MLWRKVARKQLTSSVVNTCGLLVSRRWSFRGVDWTVMVVGVSLLRARRPGIGCQTVFATHLWVLAFSGVTWKRTFFAKYWRYVLGALEIFFMRMRYINSHFTYLIFLTCWYPVISGLFWVVSGRRSLTGWLPGGCWRKPMARPRSLIHGKSRKRTCGHRVIRLVS